VGARFQKVSARSIAQTVHAAHRVSGWKTAAQGRRHQQITLANVDVGGQKRQSQPGAVATAHGNGLQACAVHFNRNAMIRIGDQDGARVPVRHLQHLAQHAVRIDQRLAAVDAFATPLVERDLVAVRVLVDVDDLGDQHFFVQRFAGRQQYPQPFVLGLDGLQTLQARLQPEQGALQLVVLGFERLATLQAFGDEAGAHRGLRHPHQRRQRGGHALAHGDQVIALMVGEHQPHRQQHQQQRGQAQATDADLSGVGIDVVTVHAGRRVRTGRWTDSCPSRAPGLQSKL